MAFEIVDLLKDINEKGTTVVMVTHEHDLVRQFDKRVITLEDGRVVSDGDIEESPLVDTYEQKYVETQKSIRRRKRKSKSYYPDDENAEELSEFMRKLDEETGHVNEVEENVEEIYNTLESIENNAYSVYLDEEDSSKDSGGADD
ncbi:hypothetical protein SDC9_134992 [bioreactor metagenome]|uniref:Cell division ATP-binding protein FtsE n=1 Tax=bioreactor metagenome TaxID=1076179 RepID=A0A645DH28_9ZZZZ